MAAMLLGSAALGLILPTPPDPPAIVVAARPAVAAVPTSTALAGLFGPEPTIYKGGAASLDLGSLLDTVPTDAGGKKGIERDQKGIDRMMQRAAEEEQAAKEKYDLVVAMEAQGKEVSFQSDVMDSAAKAKESTNAGIAAANALFGR